MFSAQASVFLLHENDLIDMTKHLIFKSRGQFSISSSPFIITWLHSFLFWRGTFFLVFTFHLGFLQPHWAPVLSNLLIFLTFKCFNTPGLIPRCLPTLSYLLCICEDLMWSHGFKYHPYIINLNMYV
jgi:hypothetical protein